MQSEYAQHDRTFSIGEIDGQSRQILAQNPTTWAIRFSNRKITWSLKSRCYPRQQGAAERSMSWMVTQLFSEVASHPTRTVVGGRCVAPWLDYSRLVRARA